MADDAPLPDVAVVGLGPAGRALAHRCRVWGLTVVAIDLSPDRPWSATYGAWEDELPGWLPADVIASRISAPAVRTRSITSINRTYCVFDTAALQSILEVDDSSIIAGRATAVTHSDVTLADGSVIRARHVIDARGVGSARDLARQTAYGVVIDAATAAPALNGRTAWFMDWKRDNGTSAQDAPSFLYAIPLDDRRVLLEETCLVGRPPLALAALRARLETRLAARGVALPDQPTVERVRFVVEPPGRPQRGSALSYGARGGLIHPGTGYSVASALAHTDRVAEALSLGKQPYNALWPRSARVVAILRRAGLHALLELDADHADHFFDAFFAIPVDLQRAYLSSRADSIRTLAAMWYVFRGSPAGVRRAILRGIVHRNRRYQR